MFMMQESFEQCTSSRIIQTEQFISATPKTKTKEIRGYEENGPASGEDR